MVGVPVLLMVCVSAFVPFVWVMGVVVGVSWWCVFQWCVAVVPASRRVPGVGVCVSWLVPGACLGVVWLVVGACGVCARVGWLVLVGVCGLVCVLWWFRMLTCSGLFLVFLVLFVWLITVGVSGGGFCGVKVAPVGLVLVWGCFCLCLLACARVAWRGCGLVWVKGVWGFRVSSGLLGYWCCWPRACVWVCARGWRLVLLWGVCLLGVSGESGCLGAGCVVAGGGLPESVGVVVASGGVGVSFDVGLRVFVLSGVSVPVSGSASVSGSSLVGSLASECGGAGVSAPVGSVSSPGSGCVVPVLPGAGVVVPESDSVPVSGVSGGPAPVSVAVSVAECGGVVVCVPCAARVFGDGWCFLVLRRWARAAGVDVAKVDGLLGSGCVGGGSAASLRSPALVVASSPGFVSASDSVSSSPSPVSGGSASLRSPVGGGRVGVGFGARVRDWGARVGVGGGVVSGGGVVAGWWRRAVGRVRALVSGVGVKGLVLLGLVGVVLLVSAKVLVG